jgi:hypothetical protein
LSVPVRSLLCNFDHAYGVLEATDEVDASCGIPITLDRAGEPIGAKESECLPHLAPGDENACQVHEAELDRSHASLAAPLTIDIDDMKTRLPEDGLAQS